MLNSYLSILEDSLKKKLAVLEQIDEVSDVQTALLKEETFDLERFDATVDEKDAFIKQLSELDDGFEKFSAMETALAKLQSNSSAVTSLLGGS